MPHSSTSTTASMKLLADAADCGLRITGLDGWTQTRLAGALQIRRETLNAIINQSPGAEPTAQRPRMVEACRKLITFAAALAAKEDAVLKLPVDMANLQSDDGQAYEHHRLRLHQLVEAAAVDQRYAEALCRVGEFASAALHAAPAYRLRMICNLATAIQRLLDKPASRQIPLAVLKANLARLYRAERCARGILRGRRDDPHTIEQADYVRGQVGYALVFTGLLLPDARLVTRGGRRLFRAAEGQPDASYGHWSNLLRAIDDLLAIDADLAHQWASRAADLAARQGGEAYLRSRDALTAKGEIQRLRAYWAGDTARAVAAPANGSRRRAARLAAWGAAMVLATLGTRAARAGDGRDFRSSQAQPTAPMTPQVQSQPVPAPGGTTQLRGRGWVFNQPAAASAGNNSGGAAQGSPMSGRRSAAGGLGSLSAAAAEIPADSDVPPPLVPSTATAQRFAPPAARTAAGPARSSTGVAPALEDGLLPDGRSVQDAWGDRIQSLTAAAGAAASLPAAAPVPASPQPPHNPPPATGQRGYVNVAAMTQMLAPPVVPPTPEERATQALSMARNYLTAGRTDLARQKLEAVVASYPQTAAAKEAQALLQQRASAN